MKSQAWALWAIGAAIALLAVGGFALSRPGGTPRGAMEYRVALNASASNSAQLGGSLHLLGRLAGMIEERDALSVWRVDDRVRQLVEGPAPGDTETLLARLRGELEPLSEEKGTRALPFFQRAAAGTARGRGIIVMYFTDGWEEGGGPAEIQGLREVGEKLAASPEVRAVHLIGVAKAAEPFWLKAFGGLGPRLRIGGPLRRDTIEQIEAAADARI